MKVVAVGRMLRQNKVKEGGEERKTMLGLFFEKGRKRFKEEVNEGIGCQEYIETK